MPTITIPKAVKLVPSQGCYQKPKPATLVGETRTEWRAVEKDSSRQIRFRKSDGRPIGAWDQQFPCYYLEIPE